jgi:hypothetical protein
MAVVCGVAFFLRFPCCVSRLLVEFLRVQVPLCVVSFRGCAGNGTLVVAAALM